MPSQVRAEGILLAVIVMAFVLGGCAAPRVPASRQPSVEASSTPESEVSTFAPPAFVEFANDLQDQEYSEPTTGTAWYPTYVPRGFALVSIETTTLGEGSGPVCDVVFAKGRSKIYLAQGSPVMRDYEIVPIDTIAWGTEQAWTMDADGESGGRKFIVYGDSRNLGELSGDVGVAELKKIAASMRPVP